SGQAVDVVVVAPDGDRAGAVERGSDHLPLLEVVGDEDEAVEPGPSRVRRHRVGEVARRRAGDRVESELDRLGDRHRDDATLVGERGVVDRVVLDPQVSYPQHGGQPVGADERGEPRVQADGGLALDGEQLAITPQVSRPTLDGLARHHAPDGVVVVLDFQGTEARLADVQRGDGGFGAALAAPEPFGMAHEPTLLCAKTSRCKGPQAAQEARDATSTRREAPPQPSNVSSLPATSGSAPASTRTASAPWRVPASTTAGPSTPAS